MRTIFFALLFIFLDCIFAGNKHHHKYEDDIAWPLSLGPIPKNDNFCQSFIKNGICNFQGQPKFIISSTNPCIFNCTYDPSQISPGPIRMKVHLHFKDIFSTNVFVSIRQNHLESSWTLPILFPEHGKKQPFTTIEELLCPPREESVENLFFRIETISEDDIQINVSLSPAPYLIKLEEKVTLVSSPVSSWFKFYQWQGDQESVLVIAEFHSENGKDVCALLSMQNAECPVRTDKKGIIGAGSGRYQTFQQRGGMVAKKSMYPDGVHIVILPLPDDVLCTGKAEGLNITTSRSKSTILQVLPHKTISETYGIFMAVALVVSAVIITSTLVVIHFGIQRNVDALMSATAGESDDDEQLIGGHEHSSSDGGVRRTFTSGGVFFPNNSIDGNDAENREPTSGQIQNSRIPPDVDELFVNADLVVPEDGFVSDSHRAIRNHMLAIQESPNVSDPINAVARPHSESGVPRVLQPTSNYNPRCVYWWKMSSEYSNVYSTSDDGFHKNLIIVAIFMSLPLSEILRSYLHVFHYHGSEDQCYFNCRCIVSFGIFPDFARVFTNFAYLLCGVCFAVILREHKRRYWEVSKGELLGVSRNYNLFLALAVGLVIQFVMSGLYHICPNIVTLRFDLMFMYVLAIVLIIGVWGLRHDSVAPHIYPTVGIVGLALLVAELRDWINLYLFWIAILVIQSFFTLTISVMLYKTSTWSFSPMEMMKIWKKWKPLLKRMSNDLLNEETSIKPWTLLRMILGVFSNLTLIPIGFFLDMEIYKYILIVCLTNMGLYVTNYIFTKKLNREKGTMVAWMCLGFSFLWWILGFIFYYFNSTNSEVTASASRDLNSGCILFGVFDSHDIWHLTSALALFYSFIGILTLDDDLAGTSPQNFVSF